MSLLHSAFDGEYELAFSAWGEGVLRESDLLEIQKPDHVFAAFQKTHRRYPKDISLLIEDSLACGFDYGFTSVDTMFLEKLETLKELILPDSITQIDMTPKLHKILTGNNTLIRGTFDSFAEHFAAENALHFRPSDYVFARHFFEPAQESTVLSLVFNRNGSVQIREEISSPGSSAGNTFGGSFYYKLRKDFYKTKTVEQVAEQFRGVLYDATIESGKLDAFLEKAKTHKIYMGKN